MDLEFWTHIGVIAFLIIDAASHIWRHRPWKRREPKYTLDQARALLFDEAIAKQPIADTGIDIDDVQMEELRSRKIDPNQVEVVVHEGKDVPFVYPTVGTEKDCWPRKVVR